MKVDDLNEWQILYEDEQHDSLLMEPAAEKRSKQHVFPLPSQTLSLPPNVKRDASPAVKSTRTSTATWEMNSPSKRQSLGGQSFKTLKVCHNCNEAVVRTAKGTVRSVRLSGQMSAQHMNNLMLQLNNPEIKVENTIYTSKSARVIRIRKPAVDYNSLKIQAETDPQQRNYWSCMPKSSQLHSRKYSALYREAVKKELERKEMLKKLPRRKRKKFMAKVSPDAPPVQYEEKVEIRPEPLRKDRRMLNFRMEERKSLPHQPALINENTLFDILKLRREIRLGILTSRS